MTYKITLIEDHGDWPVPNRRYRIEGEAGYCEFSIWENDGTWLSSFGGSTWPFSWPEVFEYVNPNTYHAGYVIRNRSVLPA